MIKDVSTLEIISSLNKNIALAYASRGWAVIPLFEIRASRCECGLLDCPSPGKHPRTSKGLKDGTIDPSIISQWWNQWPNANIGIVTGSRSGIIVLDIDPKNGGMQSLEALEQTYGKITTLKVYSGGGGFHFYFTLENQNIFKNHVNIYPGVDVRAENGYIVAPPSSHLSGQRYFWEKDFMYSIEPEVLPSWLAVLLNTSSKPWMAHQSSQTHSQIGPGARNSFLTSLAGVSQKFGLTVPEMEKILWDMNQKFCAPPLSLHEIQKISKSISKYKHDQKTQDLWGPLKLMDLGNDFQLPTMTLDFIPAVLHNWIEDISNRMQIPLELIAIPVVVAMGSLIGRKIRIYPKQKDLWIVTPNLWGAVVARPGTLKTPAIAEALTPLEKIVEEEHESFQKKMSLWMTKKTILAATESAIKDQLTIAIEHKKTETIELLKEQLEAIQKEIEESTPRCRRFKTNDATVEKIVEMLQENPNGLLMVRDELSGWLESLNKTGREGERQFYLEAWSARGSYTVDRIGRGTTHLSSLCLSVFGALQPDRLSTLLTTPLKNNDDGLLQRFQLLVSPTIKKDWINHDITPDQAAQKEVENLFRRVANYTPQNNESFLGLRFEEKAQHIFDEWRTALEKTLRSQEIDHIHYEAHLAKYRSLIPSLALIFSIIDSDSLPHYVSECALKLALKWSDYLLEHAKNIYQVHKNSNCFSIQKLAEKIQKGKIQDGDTVRSVMRNCWQGLKTHEDIEYALEYLENLNWLKVKEEKKLSGRTSKVIYLHPDFISNTI